jgi:TIR domain
MCTCCYRSRTSAYRDRYLSLGLAGLRKSGHPNAKHLLKSLLEMAKGKDDPANPYVVFISHATNDKWLATVLCEKIEEVGARTFRDDRDINGGDDISDQIRDAIVASSEVLVLLTPDSIDRIWVHLEIGAAWGLGPDKRISVVLCHVGIDPIPAMLKSKKAIPINQFPAYLHELKARVGVSHAK